MSVIVTDKSDHSLDDVGRDDLQVLEDGKRKELYSFSREEKPVRYAIAVDNSLSFAKLFGAAQLASKLIIERNGPGDETALISFVSSSRLNYRQPFTADKSKLLEALAQVYIEGGPTAVIDGLYISVQTLTESNSGNFRGRQAVVLISDGENRQSYYSQNDLVKLLRQSYVTVFVIGMVTKLDRGGFTVPSPREKAEKLLRLVAEESGGRVFFPRTVGELERAASEIAHDLHTQFEVAYQVSGTPAKGFHKVQVKTAGQKRLIAYARTGYFFPAPDVKEGKKSSP